MGTHTHTHTPCDFSSWWQRLSSQQHSPDPSAMWRGTRLRTASLRHRSHPQKNPDSSSNRFTMGRGSSGLVHHSHGTIKESRHRSHPQKKPGQLVEPLYNGPGRLQFGAPLAWDKQRITPQEPPTKKPGQLVEPLYNGPGRFQFGALLHFGAPLAWDMQRITPQVPGADESNPPSLSKKQPPTIFEGVPLESDYDTRDLQPMDTTAG